MQLSSVIAVGCLSVLALSAIQVNAQPPEKSQANPNVQVNKQAAWRALSERFVAAHIALYGSDNNATNKTFHDWTGKDLWAIPDGAFYFYRSFFYDEQFDLIDQILPNSMSREEFARALLREDAWRRLQMDFYDNRFGFNSDEVVVQRPLDVRPADQITVRTSPSAITIRDAAIDFLTNPRQAVIVVKPDVMAQTGPYSESEIGFHTFTDTGAYDLGYTVGVHPDFQRSGKLPIGIRFEESEEQVKAFYCWASKEIFARQGRSLNQAQAFAIGFIQGRTDAKKGYYDTSIPLAALGPCPQNPPAVTPLNPILLDFLRPSGAPMSGQK